MSSHDFCQILLKSVMKNVRKVTTAYERKAAWAYRFSGMNGAVEFHGPGEFYWHGRGHCLYEAKAKGWEAWLKEHHSETTDSTP